VRIDIREKGRQGGIANTWWDRRTILGSCLLRKITRYREGMEWEIRKKQAEKGKVSTVSVGELNQSGAKWGGVEGLLGGVMGLTIGDWKMGGGPRRRG